MFYTIKELVEKSAKYDSVADLMVQTEMENTNRSKEFIRSQMERNLEVMEQSIQEGVAGVKSVTGLTGGDAKLMNEYIQKGDFLSGEPILEAVRKAVAVNGVNAKMGLICATPTAGRAGALRGGLGGARDRCKVTSETA